MQANEFLLRCQKAADQRFGITTLRESQVQVLRSLCSHEPTQMQAVLATMPTGSGKTLIYALASIVLKKHVLVISPLIALMREQVIRMREAHILAFMASGEQTQLEKMELIGAVKKNQVDMIFASPEKCFTQSFQTLLAQFKPSLVVCDEAHCVASWGHGFRPEYSKIADFIKKIKPQQVLALSATIPGALKSIVQKRLVHGSENIKWTEITSDPLPQNLYLESLRTFSESERNSLLFKIIQESLSHKIIIYFSRRSLCETMASQLNESGFNAFCYHAGLDKELRKNTEILLRQSEKFVVCATLAYGMGVDLFGVQHVICYGLPTGISEFIQMIGRAGRNGVVARGSLLWTGSDVKKKEYQLKLNFPGTSLLVKAHGSLLQHLPNSPNVRWLSWNQVTKIWFSNGIKENCFQGVFNAFRFLGVVKSTFPFINYLSVAFCKSSSLDDELESLPEFITQRKQILTALKQFFGVNWSATKGAESWIPIPELEEATGLSFVNFEKVLSFYKEKGILLFSIRGGGDLEQGLLFEKCATLSRKTLREYEKVVLAEKESLWQLIELANSKECRLNKCKKYFNGSNSADVDLAQYLVYCNQCDICMERQKKLGEYLQTGDMYNNFGTFQKLWLELDQKQTVTF